MFRVNDILEKENGEKVVVISNDGKLLDRRIGERHPRFDLGKILCLDTHGKEEYLNWDKLKYSEVQDRINSLSFLIDKNRSLEASRLEQMIKVAKGIIKDFSYTKLKEIEILDKQVNPQRDQEYDEFELKMNCDIACRAMNKYFRQEFKLWKE